VQPLPRASGSRCLSSLVITSCLALLAGCATYNEQYPRTPSTAFQDYEKTRLGREFGAAAAAHPGESGVEIIRYGRFALATRLMMADLAEKSLDLQYYIWDADVSGHLLAERVIRAAERGVRVRILLDDMSIAGRDASIARISGHPRIQIRAFNPFRDRGQKLDFLSDPSRVNRRSHNKIFVADNAFAIVGGRNIGDHYFGVDDESNFRDLDIAAAGPVVRDVSAVFDAFWNSKFAVPYEAFVDTAPTAEEAQAQIATGRAQIAAEPLPYPIDEDVARLVTSLDEIRDGMSWGPVRVLYDHPSKAEDKTVKGIYHELATLISGAREEVLIENAYFVPSPRGVDASAALTQRGVKIRVLTNSLASNDVAAVHSGYKKYRQDLIENGVEIYELRPDSTVKQRWSALSGQSEAGLHTKAMVVDRERVVIGSYNLDPRSANINTECALLVTSPELGQVVAEYMDVGVRPENSYHVTVDDGKLRWVTADDGKEVSYSKEPETSWWKRFMVGFMGILPIHSQL